MDSHNLATLFAPNIMHKAKGGEFEVATVERAGDRLDVISVIKEMIDKHKKVFEVGSHSKQRTPFNILSSFEVFPTRWTFTLLKHSCNSVEDFTLIQFPPKGVSEVGYSPKTPSILYLA